MPTWDDQIDETARRLTDRQLAPGFRSRVVARLDERPGRWSRAWLLAPAAAAAIVVLAVVEMDERAVRPAMEAGLKAGTTPTTEAGLKAGTAPAPEAGLKARTTSESAGLKARSISAPAGPKAEATPAPVAFETDLAVASIELTPVTVLPTVVDALVEPVPLAVEDLTIAALDTFDLGQ